MGLSLNQLSADTFADIATSTFTGVHTGSCRIVSGQNTIGDGGGGFYFYDADSTATADGFTIVRQNVIPVTDPGRWFRRANLTQIQSDYTQGTNTALDFIKNKPTIPSSTTQISEGSNLYFTNARSRTAISLTTTGSGAASYNNSTGVLNVPTPASPTAPTFNNAVSRSLSNAAGSTNQYTISTTQRSVVYYTITLSVSTPLLAGTASAQVFLEYSTNAGSSWNTVADISNSQSVGLSVSVAITMPQNMILSGEIPANALVRLRTVTSGSTPGVATYVRGQEVLY